MCIVSNIMDYGRGMWPSPGNPGKTIPEIPNILPGVPWTVAPQQPTPEEWAEFLELVEKAKAFDEMTGEAECEDPEKVAWFDEVNESVGLVEKVPGTSGTFVAVEIEDFTANKGMLEIWIKCEALDLSHHYWRRRDVVRDRSWGWFFNDTQGSRPQNHEQMDPVLNDLVLNHPVLCQIADQYEIW